MSFLYVIPNPYTVLDAEGNPCGFCLADPLTSRPFQIVGGVQKKKIIPQEAGNFDKRSDPRGPRVFSRPEITLAVVRVMDSKYHQERVASGDLIAADLKTAKLCLIDKKDFKAPSEVLAEFLKKRVAEWQAANDGELPPCAGVSFACEGEGESLVVKVLPAGSTPTPPPGDTPTTTAPKGGKKPPPSPSTDA